MALTLESYNAAPTVSVIIATYNREEYVKQAIASIFEQTYKNYEIIVIDDGSTDITEDVIKSMKDPRLHYIKQCNKGRSNARNVGIRLAKGRYIAFLDSDDLYLPHKLSLQVEYLDKNPNVGMIYTSAYCIDENGNSLRHTYKATVSGSIYDKIAYFVPVTITLPTVMVRREIISKLGGFDENLHRFEDTDMWRRISKKNYIAAINNYTCKLRTHSDNHLFAQNPKQLIQAVDDYAKKILQEDYSKRSFIQKRRLGGLYYYYAKEFFRVPEWKQFSRELIQIANEYWPFYAILFKLNIIARTIKGKIIKYVKPRLRLNYDLIIKKK